MEKIAEKIVDSLISHQHIKKNEKDDYVYAMIMLMEKWISISIVLILSILFQKTIPTILFLIFLLAIKRRSGGFHADTFGKCLVLTVGIYMCFVIFLYPIMVEKINLTYILLAVSILIFLVIGAVNHPNMQWNLEEYEASKNASRLVVILEGIMLWILDVLTADSGIIVCMAFAIILSAILLLIAKVKKQEVL